jgi:hypothetical protein
MSGKWECAMRVSGSLKGGQSILDCMSDEGWELVTVLNGGYADDMDLGLTFYFKRRKSEVVESTTPVSTLS